MVGNYQQTYLEVKSKRRAFTLVEVALVIAITSLMLLAFIATIAGRIGAQRYRDATNSFADFMRSVYSEVINVENSRLGQIKLQNGYCTLSGQAAGLLDHAVSANDNPEESYPGRSGCAIYGKLVSFGENNSETVYVYDVIGRAADFSHPIIGASTTIEELKAVHADVLALVPDEENNTNSTVSLSTAALSSSYIPQWGSRAEAPNGELFHAAILIVRAPSSGAVRTFFLNRTLPIQELISDYRYNRLGSISSGNTSSLQTVVNAVENSHADMSDYLHAAEGSNASNDAFVLQEVDFCVASGNIFAGFVRNDIRIKADGHNSTAVEFVESDLSASEGGNKCRN